MSQSSWWEKVKGGSKKGFDTAWKGLDKLGAPVNKLSNKLGSEAFWPTTLDKESDKAARILKSFCKDGFYAEEDAQPTDGPKQKQKVVKKIPEKVIRNAKGLAIFTTMRTGLWVSGAGGSGILVGRMSDGTWSPPSGILLHTAGLGFLVGVDIYDCVVVINTDEALEAFCKIRCTLGSEISVAAGPVGAGGILESELHKRQAPIFTYLKSRGFYAGVQIDGTVIIERTDENERFYGERIPVRDILAGKVRHPPYETRQLMQTIKAAQGDTDVDESVLPDEPPPGDYVVEDDHMFGIPDKEDPDPYGVLALEKEGLSLKEAGTSKRASWEQFAFNPSPTSPIHAAYRRNSQERDRRSTLSNRSSWRASAFGNENKRPSSLCNSMEQGRPPSWPRSTMVDTSTQTEVSADPPSPGKGSTRSGTSSRISLITGKSMQGVPENEVLASTPEPKGLDNVSRLNGYSTPPRTPPVVGGSNEDKNQRNDDHDVHSDTAYDDDAHDYDAAEDEVEIEEPVVHSIQAVQPTSPQAISKARIVTVQKRAPPKLPARNPNRSGPLVIDASPRTPSADGQKPIEVPDSSTEPEKTEITDRLPENPDELQEKLEDVKLDDDVPMPDPWGKAEEARANDESTRMPGAF